jgi:molybdopterin-containing oxidoreductase family membrane subunit
VVGLAGLLVASTFIGVRLNIVVHGLVHPELVGLERAYTDLRLTFAYVPSQMEILVGLFVVAFGVGLFLLGRWLLPLTPSEAVIVPPGPNSHEPQLSRPLVQEPTYAAR